MHIANKTGWQTEFTVPMATLEFKTGLKKSTIYNARNTLRQLGRINFRERGGNQCSVYSLFPFNGSNRDTNATQTGGKADTNAAQNGPLDKLNETKQEDSKKDDFVISKSRAGIIAAWNSLKLQEMKIIQGKREDLLSARIKQYGESAVFEAIENIKKSSFLRGQSKSGFTVTFDWLVKPNNFPKVLEGNYSDKPAHSQNIAFSNEK
jgi:hypothetical protein